MAAQDGVGKLSWGKRASWASIFKPDCGFGETLFKLNDFFFNIAWLTLLFTNDLEMLWGCCSSDLFEQTVFTRPLLFSFEAEHFPQWGKISVVTYCWVSTVTAEKSKKLPIAFSAKNQWETSKEDFHMEVTWKSNHKSSFCIVGCKNRI